MKVNDRKCRCGRDIIPGADPGPTKEWPKGWDPTSIRYCEKCSGCYEPTFACKCSQLGDTVEKKSNDGKRFDQGKSRMSLIPFVAIRAIGDVYTYGAKKYKDHNWLDGMKWSRMSDSMLRHYERFSMGEAVDAESNLLHSAHMAWNAIGLLTYELLGIGTDDRWKDRADYIPDDLAQASEKTFAELDPEGTGKA